MSDRSDNAPSSGDSGPSGEVAGPETIVVDRLRNAEPGGIDPVRYGMLGAGTFGALGAAWLVTVFVQLQVSDPTVFASPGPIGIRAQEPGDIHFSVVSAYYAVVQLGPLLGVLLGLVVGQSVAERSPDGIVATSAVTAGGLLAMFLLAIGSFLTHPETSSVDVVSLFEPSLYSSIAVFVACLGSAAAFLTFESLDSAAN